MQFKFQFKSDKIVFGLIFINRKAGHYTGEFGQSTGGFLSVVIVVTRPFNRMGHGGKPQTS